MYLDEEESQNDNLYECVDQPGEKEKVRFFNYIASLIEIFNDAKRLTLSAWSWRFFCHRMTRRPSHHSVAEKATHFKTNGTLLSTPD